jgi:hypothetical protein
VYVSQDPPQGNTGIGPVSDLATRSRCAVRTLDDLESGRRRDSEHLLTRQRRHEPAKTSFRFGLRNADFSPDLTSAECVTTTMTMRASPSVAILTPPERDAHEYLRGRPCRFGVCITTGVQLRLSAAPCELDSPVLLPHLRRVPRPARRQVHARVDLQRPSVSSACGGCSPRDVCTWGPVHMAALGRGVRFRRSAATIHCAMLVTQALRIRRPQTAESYPLCPVKGASRASTP